MDLEIRDRVAIVTGGSSGLGLAVARELCRERAKVVIVARNEARLRSAVDEIRRTTGGQISAAAGDLTREDDVARVVEDTVARWGRLDITIANVGGPRATSYETTAPEQYQHAAEMILLSTVRLARAVTPHMKRQRWGRFIALGSVSARQPVPRVILANTLRPAVVGFVKTMAQELAPYNVLCNVVAPGFMRTGRIEELLAEQADREGTDPVEVMKELHARIPLGRMGDPEELASLVAFLASERGSYITGATIQVDGGFIQAIP